jgi:hypothetical protein
MNEAYKRDAGRCVKERLCEIALIREKEDSGEKLGASGRII